MYMRTSFVVFRKRFLVRPSKDLLACVRVVCLSPETTPLLWTKSCRREKICDHLRKVYDPRTIFLVHTIAAAVVVVLGARTRYYWFLTRGEILIPLMCPRHVPSRRATAVLPDLLPLLRSPLRRSAIVYKWEIDVVRDHNVYVYTHTRTHAHTRNLIQCVCGSGKWTTAIIRVCACVRACVLTSLRPCNGGQWISRRWF